MHACMYISMYGFGVKVGNGSEVSGGEGLVMILSIYDIYTLWFHTCMYGMYIEGRAV